ncbi:regulatory protein [Atopostipes suicloacalis DSM 15692]|uniref:Regulatory protein RecX n=1 Tax=Atopostipes suicloacalis DSM 15692 TaxID=1121025 RepID=A0A1M4TKH1_9LACT|nr:recombination regulator RecX [Atopostipes suicloacalis]SHE44896.1 regulatory protein [Atopostipes suicloacalis DSM 15692]
MSNEKNLINLGKENKKKENKQVKKSNEKQSNSKKDVSSKSFRMISKIEPQKRKGRYNVYINDDFAFGIDEEVLIKFELNKGLHVTKELQEKIENEDSYYKAYQKTLNYLSYSLRSEKQIRDYLAKHELYHFSDRMIEQLKSMRLIDDLNFAQSYVRSQANINQKGPRNIEQDLKQKGIKEEFILTALDEYPYEQQLENAISLASKKWGQTSKNSEIESVQKVKAYLLNKGYTFDLVNEAITAIDTEKDNEVEYNALVKQGDKAARRYSRKYEGYELTQRLKGYLYNKGYPTELINRYMDEREME